MSSDLLQNIVRSFLSSSKSSIMKLLKSISSRKVDGEKVIFHTFDGKNMREEVFDGSCFFLRTSMEYSSPQLTLEELEGLLAARLLEVCANHCIHSAMPESQDIEKMAEALRRPPTGTVVPFIFETDDVEPDRYSNNPLRSSIVESGQSAFPVATATTDALKLDKQFLQKYEGSLISKDEVELVQKNLGRTNRYVDFVDMVKFEELYRVYEDFGLELRLPLFRMPLEVLMNEEKGGPFHSLVQASHMNYVAMDTLYTLMGRSIKKKTSLLTVPHSPKGYGSKRAARGKLTFSNGDLESIRVQYKKTSLYPNMVDYKDVSFAKCEDSLEFTAKRFTDYSFQETPSSPQFVFYSIFSPENASIWHGVGEYAGEEILRSYASVQDAFLRRLVFQDVKKPKIREEPPIMLNLDPEKMWKHPIYGNIDGGIGCVEDLSALLVQEIRLSPITVKLRKPPST